MSASNSISAKRQAKPAPKITIYQWQGLNKQGEKVSGELRGTSMAEIRSKLKSQGIRPKRVHRQSKPLFKLPPPKVSAMDIAMMTRQIATMLTAGVPLVTSIELIARGHEKIKMRELLGQILEDIQSGTPLSEALRAHRLYFDDLFVDLVAAGEHAGALETVFDRIALYKEKAEQLKSKIKKALFYPITVVIVAIAVTSMLLLFVVPQFEEIFNGFGAELPSFTQIVIQISKGLQASWHFMAVGFIIGIIVFIRMHRHSLFFRDKVDALVLKIPVIGPILHKAAMARFARTLATTFGAGVPLIDGLESAAGASGNAVYRNAVLKMREQVVSGMQMNTAMHTTGLFPDMLVQMVMIGEESGSLDNMLNKVANIYEMQVDDAVDGLASLIEPVMMVVIGTLVGGLIVAMYLPIFQMGKIVS
ncbi:type II secretion system F family protein [uncultured Shewanella sp.]|uniref:type II secretion system F family protein n=1 Tax=uncultured Shewanella sp. TaxID=173975 RepID=UPI002625BB08|nr:type II secretion system F family protein [uncultured Shewanella sp.]